MAGFGVYPARKVWIPVLAAIHFGLLLYLYIADVKMWDSLLLLIIFVGGGAVWASVRWRRKGFTIAFLAVCFFAAAQLLSGPVIDDYFLCILLSLLLVGFMPGRVADRSIAPYRFAIKAWRRKLAKGGGDAGGDPIRLERLMEAAIVLGVGKKFLKSVRRQYPEEILYRASPLFQPDFWRRSNMPWSVPGTA